MAWQKVNFSPFEVFFIHCIIMLLSRVNFEHVCHWICFAGCEFEMQIILLSGRWKMGLRVAYLTKFLLVVLGLVFYCEFLIYYIVLLQVSDISYIVTFTFVARNCWHDFPYFKFLSQESAFALVVRIHKWTSQCLGTDPEQWMQCAKENLVGYLVGVLFDPENGGRMFSEM
jgi:hypothetical protein